MLHLPFISTTSIASLIPSFFGDISGLITSKFYRHRATFRYSHSVASLHRSNTPYNLNSLLRDIWLPSLSHSHLRQLTTLLTNQIPSSTQPAAPTTNDVITQYIRIQKRRLNSVRLENEVKELEDKANDSPRDVQAQESYLRAVLEMDPQYVSRRYETGRYAINNAIRRIYQDALILSGHFSSKAQTPAPSSSPSPSASNTYSNAKGTAESPLIVDIAQKKYKWLRDLSKIFLYLFIATYVLHALEIGFKGALPHMRKPGFSQDSEKKYKFSDVQGAREAKEELMEVVDFLRNPEKFQRLGAKMPKGVLLVGKPGTGKTLLARAVAGEANVPFFYTSGSEFDEMYVGVGAARLRNLFQTAKNSKPCVIFIDELDAVGGARIASEVHPYARMTLNQLLVELDGYKENEEIVVIGATNFPQSLDKALVRPGRFDLKIYVSLPDLKARHDILKLYLGKVKCDPDLDVEGVARSTLGMTGADLANLVNQAAIQGSVLGKEFVTREDIEMAEDKIRMGPQRKSMEQKEKNKELTAYHEAGHALVSLYTEGSMQIRKATIIPRGEALGMVSFFPTDESAGHTRREMLAQMDSCMGGRAAEEIIYGDKEITNGAASDLRAATGVAKSMVTRFGMSEKLGPIFIEDLSQAGGDLRKSIDNEIQRLLSESFSRAQSILRDHSKEHHNLARALLKYETLDLEEIRLVMKGNTLNRNI